MQLVLSTDSTFKTSLEALQIRIKYRWQAIDQENEAIKSQEKQKSLNLMSWLMEILKQLLARSRYFLYKTNQSGLKPLERAFYYLICIPIFKKAYHLTQDLRNIFEKLLIK
jgi:hypothetical protein